LTTSNIKPKKLLKRNIFKAFICRSNLVTSFNELLNLKLKVIQISEEWRKEKQKKNHTIYIKLRNSKIAKSEKLVSLITHGVDSILGCYKELVINLKLEDYLFGLSWKHQ
tara:strand:+ start:424 stop:753 length:330 start_codon:yes stop_codon:yes gene_type:complete